MAELCSHETWGWAVSLSEKAGRSLGEEQFAEGREQETTTSTGQGWKQGRTDHNDYKGEIGYDWANESNKLDLTGKNVLSFLSPLNQTWRKEHKGCLWDMFFLQVNLEKGFGEYWYILKTDEQIPFLLLEEVSQRGLWLFCTVPDCDASFPWMMQ